MLIDTEALSDFQIYVNAEMASENYVEPARTACRSVTYRQLFEELKSPMYKNLIQLTWYWVFCSHTPSSIILSFDMLYIQIDQNGTET